MKRIILFSITTILFASLNSNAANTIEINCTAKPNYTVQAIVQNGNVLSASAFKGSDDLWVDKIVIPHKSTEMHALEGSLFYPYLRYDLSDSLAILTNGFYLPLSEGNVVDAVLVDTSSAQIFETELSCEVTRL